VATGERGAVAILLPRDPFALQAFAPGFRTETFGPFAPEDLAELGGEPLVLRLPPGQAARGRVTFQGRPVRGARIGLSPSSASHRTLVSVGITPPESPFRPRATVDLQQHDANTDDAGRFLATLHRDGWHSVLVQAPGLPLTVFGPFEWSQDMGVDGMELELLAGGAIEGRVLTPAGSLAAGRLVGVSSDWNFLRSTTVAEDGSFRLDDLAPGDYQVRPLQPPVASLQNYPVRGLETSTDLAWDCRVRPGETTRFDLDLTSEGTVVLAGRFAWDTTSPDGGSVHLWRRDSDEPLAHAELDAEGRFELSLSRAEPATLQLWTPHGEFTRALDLAPGLQTFEARIPFGALRFRGDFTGQEVSDGLRIDYAWENDDGLRTSGRIYPLWREPGQDILLERVPAGTLHLERGGEAWHDVVITPGEETVVDVPSDR